MPLDVTDIEAFQNFHQTIKDDHRKCIPATITAVHADRCTVDVVPAIQNPLFDEYGVLSFEQLPTLSDVPLGVMRGGGFIIWIPVQVGDSVLVVFSDLSTESWRSASAGTSPVTPVFTGKHTPAGPFAIPCVAPDVAVPTQPGINSGNVIIGKDGSDEQIQITSSDILLGKSATDFVALSNKVLSELNSIASTLSGHTHTGVTPGSGISGISDSTYSPNSVAATLVKAQ